MDDLRYFIGREGFIWFLGVVEDRNDPDQLGRVRVRCFGWHTDDKSQIPTDALPWAHPVHPISVPSSYAPKEGDWVVGFFADGNSAQHPMILGVLPGKPKVKPDSALGFSDPSGVYPKRVNESTLNRLSRGRTDGTVVETRKRNLKKGVQVAGGSTWNEPSPAYGTQYPFNFAIESESGHALELDDTKGKERVQLAHKSGTSIEMDAKGNRVEKIVKDNYTVVMGNDYMYVSGKCNITVDGDLNLRVGGTFNVEATRIHMSSAEFKALGAVEMSLETSGAMNIKGGKESNFGGGTTTVVGTTATIQGATVDVVAAMVDLQSPSSVDGPSSSGLKLMQPTKTSAIPATTLPSSRATDALSKGLGGVSETVSGVYSGTLSNISTGMEQLNSQMPMDELTGAMQGLESNLNNVSGEVANLDQDQITNIQNATGELVNTAAAKGITMNIVPSMLPPVADQSYITGKQLYPKTETILKGGG